MTTERDERKMMYVCFIITIRKSFETRCLTYSTVLLRIITVAQSKNQNLIDVWRYTQRKWTPHSTGIVFLSFSLTLFVIFTDAQKYITHSAKRHERRWTYRHIHRSYANGVVDILCTIIWMCLRSADTLWSVR